MIRKSPKSIVTRIIRKSCILCVYVDDFKLSGPKHNIKKGWDLVRRSGLKIEEPKPCATVGVPPEKGVGVYLGCLQEKGRQVVGS